MVAVNWKHLTTALEFYENLGYKQINLQWHASEEMIMTTLENRDKVYNLEGIGLLIGSAEQAFVEQYIKGSLDEGKYVSLTPCFRKEPEFDLLHQPYFMKVELFDTRSSDEQAYIIANEARSLMEIISGITPDVIVTDEGYDLEINNIEVGSYSARSYKGYNWTCGTGLAEPRFSTACSL